MKNRWTRNQKIELLKEEIEEKKFEYNQHAFRFFPYVVFLGGILIFSTNSFTTLSTINLILILVMIVGIGYSSVSIRKLRKEIKEKYQSLFRLLKNEK